MMSIADKALDAPEALEHEFEIGFDVNGDIVSILTLPRMVFEPYEEDLDKPKVAYRDPEALRKLAADALAQANYLEGA